MLGIRARTKSPRAEYPVEDGVQWAAVMTAVYAKCCENTKEATANFWMTSVKKYQLKII